MKNLVIKFSGEFFKNKEGNNLFCESKALLVQQALKPLTTMFGRIHMIIGGGNILRGRKFEKLIVQRDIYDKIGMAGTAMNALWFSSFLQEKGMKSFPLSTGKHAFMPQYDKAKTSNHNDGVIFVHGGGTNLPYLSTDTLTVVLALENKADQVLVAKNGIDGIYTADPNIDKDAKFIEKISFKEILEKQLAFMDVAAAAIANNRNIKMKVFKFEDKTSFKKVVEDKLKYSLIC